ncbi:MAG TPA: diguanylate cyclase [Anaerolineales bacterium]|nr:diguanylate cyclase [Anaerolineales bacterium]
MNIPEQNLHTTQFSDIDLLTGCFNLVHFSKEIENNFGNPDLNPTTLITLDFKQLKTVNRTKGFEHGDQLLRWLGIVLRDEMGNAIYRISGQHFAVVLIGGSTKEHEEKARDLFDYINHQAKQFDLETPVVLMAVIHFPPGKRLNTAWVWKNINEKMEWVKTGQSFWITEAESLTDDDKDTIRAIELMALRIVGLGQMMNIAFNIAYTDPVGNLPNVIAVQRKLELTFAEAESSERQFAMFLLDGDDLRRYNEVSYAAGDKLINQMSKTLMASVRPGDFVGRWRFGDEFIVLLPDTNLDEAMKISDNLRETVQKTSQTWLFPTTISIGVVHYPTHGSTLEELIEEAQRAMSAAKDAGKNRTISASMMPAPM